MNRFLVVGLASLYLAGCGLGHKGGDSQDFVMSVDSAGVDHAVRLKPASDAQEFEASAKDALRDLITWRWNQYGAGRESTPKVFIAAGSGGGRGGGVAGEAAPLGSSGGTAASADSTANNSGTNVQEQGVDEADLVKSDGVRLYVGSGAGSGVIEPTFGIGIAGVVSNSITPVAPSVKVYALGITPSATLLTTFTVGDVGARLVGLYLGAPQSTQTNRLTAVTQRYLYESNPIPDFGTNTSITTIEVYDVSDVALPKRLWRVELEGQHLATRMVNNRLYLVSQYQPSLALLNNYPASQTLFDAQLQAINAFDVSALMPKSAVNGVASHLVSAGNCFVPQTNANHVSNFSLASITELDLASLAVVGSVCTLENSALIYASVNAVYLVANSYNSNYTEFFTTLHRFEFAAAGVGYSGSGTVPGNLDWHNPAFRLSEYNGALRAVTSTFEGAQSVHRLFVLMPDNGALKIVSTLPSAAQPKAIGKPGEQIYAVRFFGNRAYVVTFKRTDPLYALDLTSPFAPVVAGELEIPGYSEYLQPIGENLLLGVGKDAVDVPTNSKDGATVMPLASDFALYQGVKVGLFDVSNPAQPLSLGDILIGKRGSQAGVAQDYHAFAMTADPVSGKYRIAIPMRVHDSATPLASVWDYAPWQYDGLHLFEVNAPAGAPATLSAAGILKSHEAVAGASNYYGYANLQRPLIVGDNVHYVEGAQVWSAPWANPQAAVGPQ